MVFPVFHPDLAAFPANDADLGFKTLAFENFIQNINRCPHSLTLVFSILVVIGMPFGIGTNSDNIRRIICFRYRNQTVRNRRYDE